jgi:hypothetical protein
MSEQKKNIPIFAKNTEVADLPIDIDRIHAHQGHGVFQ